MKRSIALATTGSRGDVQPMLALALGLIKAGHSVMLYAPPDFEDWANSLGVPFRSVGGGIEDLLAEHSEVLSSPFKLTRFMSKWLREGVDIQFGVLPDTFKDADIIIGASLFLAGPSLSEANNIPYRHIIFCPQAIQSADHPPPIIPYIFKNRSLNSYLWKFQKFFFNRLLLTIINRHRIKLGMKPEKDVLDNLTRGGTIIASEEAIAPVPEDVSGHFIQTGSLELKYSGSLNKGLRNFINAGKPPVYIGFGSMTDPDPAGTTHLIIQALKETGQRSIIYSGWANLGGSDVPDNCFITGHVPHFMLFPQTSAIIHHGGAGTVYSAARAGVPQIILPHLLDQFYWADRLYKLGLSPRPIKRSRLSAGLLASAISECVNNMDMQAKARQMAASLGNAAGVENAVAYIESVLDSNKDS